MPQQWNTQALQGLMHPGPVGGVHQVGNVGGVKYAPGFDPMMSYDQDPVRGNQMMAAATPNVNLNGPALPEWQRYNHVMTMRGTSMGGNVKSFTPPAPGFGTASPTNLPHDQYTQYAQQALQGLYAAGQGRR